jgi:hypothetical protein
MLCKPCKTALQVAFTLTSRPNERHGLRLGDTHINLHHSLCSFCKSIASGCFICRQVWAFIISCQKTFLSKIEYYPHVLVGSNPETYEQFRCQLRAIENAAEQSGHRKMEVLSSSNPLMRELFSSPLFISSMFSASAPLPTFSDSLTRQAHHSSRPTYPSSCDHVS